MAAMIHRPAMNRVLRLLKIAVAKALLFILVSYQQAALKQLFWIACWQAGL
jgi:hypothetical protein